MISAQVNAETRELLEAELKSTKDAKWYRRLMVIFQSSQGKTVPYLAEFFAISRATVRDYIHRFNSGGLEALRRQYSQGAPPKITFTKSEWQELLHQSPCQFEKLESGARNWTQGLLVKYFSAYHDIKVGQPAISMQLTRHRLRLNRGKLTVTSPDPLYTVKRERIEALKKRPSKEH
jgi:transposase